jgi:biopolymer transport protein ExbD
VKRLASRQRRVVSSNVEELNVQPLMNLFVAIVPMLLLSAVFVSLSSIDLSVPHETAAAPQAQDDFVLAIRVSERQWLVDARGETTRPVPKGDTAALLDVLRDMHALRPEHSSALLVCADTVPYDEIVQVLDVAAVAGFPDCALVGLDVAAAAETPPAPEGAQP